MPQPSTAFGFFREFLLFLEKAARRVLGRNRKVNVGCGFDQCDVTVGVPARDDRADAAGRRQQSLGFPFSPCYGMDGLGSHDPVFNTSRDSDHMIGIDSKQFRDGFDRPLNRRRDDEDFEVQRTQEIEQHDLRRKDGPIGPFLEALLGPRADLFERLAGVDLREPNVSGDRIRFFRFVIITPRILWKAGKAGVFYLPVKECFSRIAVPESAVGIKGGDAPAVRGPGRNGKMLGQVIPEVGAELIDGTTHI